MTSKNDVLLDQLRRPKPPLSPGVLVAILAVVAIINLVFALSFVLRGAGPVAPFMGGDVLLLAWAFRTSLVAARREERVTLTPSWLRIARKPPKGSGDESTFNPYWLRVEMDDPPQHWSQLGLWSHGKGIQKLKASLRNAREIAI